MARKNVLSSGMRRHAPKARDADLNKMKAPAPVPAFMTDVIEAAKASGFDRNIFPETTNVAKKPVNDTLGMHRKPKRNRTGRNTQLNIKVTQKTIYELNCIAEAQDWGLGETLEHLIDCWNKTHPAKR